MLILKNCRELLTVKEDAKENSTITVDDKEYKYDKEEQEWVEVGNPGNQKPDDQIFEKVD